MRLPITLVVTLAFLIPVAGAADAPSEAAEAGIHLVHDLGDNHTAWVGQPHSFGYVLLTEDGMTRVHQQGCIVVEQNDVVLYETTADSSHDYNALNTFQFTFERAGPFTVWVAIPDGQCGDGVQFEDHLEGVAKRSSGAGMNVSAEVSVAEGADSPGLHQIEVQAVGADGAPVNGTEAVVEVRRPGDDWMVLRAPISESADGQGLWLCYRFFEGDWLVRATVVDAAPTPRFAPTSSTTTISVASDGFMVQPANEGTCPQASEACSSQAAAASTERDDATALRTTVDPQASSSPFSRFVLNAVQVDTATAAPTGQPSFTALVRPDSGCQMPIFYAPGVASMGPLMDLVIHWDSPGQYQFDVTATEDGHASRGSLAFTVGQVLPIDGIPMPGTVGSVIVTADGLDDFAAGEPGTVTFFSSDPSGTAAAHSEIDFQILRSEWGPPLVQNKLHTHASGSFEFGYTFAEAGDYVLVVDPVTIHGEATPDYYYGELGGELVVPFSVADGPGLVDNVTDPVDDTELEGDSQIPGVGFMAFVVAAGVGLVLVRRR